VLGEHLLKQAGPAHTLQGKARYTVFAPTDAAFARVPKATLAKLAKDRTMLRSVLLYHVAKGRLSAAKVAKRHSIKTLNGQRVRDKVYVGRARVTTPNIAATKGVIHVINRVLLPADAIDPPPPSPGAHPRAGRCESLPPMKKEAGMADMRTRIENRGMNERRLGVTLFLIAAVVSFLLDRALVHDNHQEGVFVGLWVPSILAAAASG
jgi:hypothetical protein